MPSASDGPEGATGMGSDLLSSLRQRLEARRPVLASGGMVSRPVAGQAEQQQQQLPDEGDSEEERSDGLGQQRRLTAGHPVSDRQFMQQESAEQQRYDDQQNDQLLLVDLVAFDHCQELVQVPPGLEQQVLMQFSVGAWSQPLPSQARQQADQLQRLPQESVGLWVPPHPRINNGSLYKLEQRLAKGRPLDMRRIVRALQEQFPDCQQPAAVAAALGPGGLWLDESGLMLYEPSPAKPHKERPWRRYDQDAESSATCWVPASAAPLHLLNSSGASFRLDVELRRLEFEVHPYMALEQQLAAKLLCSFREYHRRASFGLSAYYGQKLAALEDALLNAREALFSAQQDPQQQQHQEDQQLKLLVAVSEAEREVAEVRQLREEEDALLLAAVQAMAELWAQLQEVRRLQGGRHLTDVAFSVVQLPPSPGEEAPLQADGLTRQQLDIALLVAEAELVEGLPAYPAPFAVSQSDAELGAFKLRRVECMASSHAVARAEVLDRLQLLEGRVSADPDDPDIQELRAQLELLGPLPSRRPLSHQQEMDMWNWAEQEVTARWAGVYRPPRLQPCLTVLPAELRGMSAHSRSAAFGSSSSGGSGSGVQQQQQPSGIAGRSRLGQAASAGSQQQLQQQPQQHSSQAPGLHGGQQQQQQLNAAAQGQVLGLGSGQLLPVQQQGPKLPAKLSYYVRLLVNGRVVGTSEVLQLRDDFTLNFRDVFSIRVLKWPDSMQMELWEKGTFLDSLVAEFFVAVPGLGGSPHVDPQAKPHSWTSPKPVPHNRLMQAVASLQPLGVLPAAVQAVSGPGQPLLQQQPLALTAGSSRLGVGSPGSARAAAALDAGEPSTADAAASSTSSGNSAEQTSLVSGTGPDSSSSGSSSTGFAAMYPSGRLFVRCGWVADAGIEPHFTPFQHTDGPFGLGQSKQTALQQSLRLPDSSSFEEDSLVQVNITGRPGAAAAPGSGIGRRLGSAPASPSKQQAGDYLGTAAFTNPLAFHGASSSPGAAGASSSSPGGTSPRKGSRFGGAAGLPGADVMIGNPLAYLGEDVEVGQTLAPPLPSLKADRALQRVAQGVGHKGSAASKWLSKHRIDPNDPRNALLLELLRAREAAAHSGQAVGAAGVFRLDLPNGLSLGVDRIADRRVAFIKQRWTAGPYRSSSTGAAGHDSLHGGRQLRVTAPLSAKDTLDLQDAHREALALIEAASMGVGGFMGALSATALASTVPGSAGAAGQRSSVAMAAASIVARQERALKWSQGVLARALETREATFRSFALRLRATASKLGAGRAGGRFKTDDVVKDTPLPEFKLDLSTLAGAFAPVRPLRPQRKAVKKVQASVPRETKLVITVQRASNLPRRLGAGGGGVRAVSPSRMTGDRFAPRRSTYGRATGGTDSFNGSQFAAAGWRGPSTQEAGGSYPAAGTFEEGDSEDPTAAAYSSRDGSGGSSGSCLSVFVEVQFRGRRQRTSAVDSNAPIWNEQVTFPVLGIDQEASPRGLRDSDSMITINVFDEVVTPTAAAKAMRAVARASNTGADTLTEGGTLPERERRFLGCIRLSLAALYQAEVVDGTFKVDVPPVLFGYVADTGRPASLAMYLTLKPRLAPPAAVELLDESFTPGEQGDVTRHARKWVAGISSLPGCKGRVVNALAVDPEGVALLLPRYLAPTVLPPALAAATEQGPKRDTNSGAAPPAAGAETAAAPSAPNTLGRSSSAARSGRGTTTGRSSSSSNTAASLVVQDSSASALDQLMLAAARWVAHLPYARHSWLGNQQQSRPWAAHADVLGMAAGGQEEHAHLLAGYFMQLGQQALVVLGTSLSGAQAAFVLTTGQPLPSPAAAPTTTGGSAEPAAEASTTTAATAAVTDGAATAAGSSSAEQDDAAAQHERLRQRLAAAAAAAQARQRVSALVAAAAVAGNPALEAAAAAAAARGAGLMQPPNVAKLRLWNPMTGHMVPVRDPSCELREVGTVYSSDNVWANIQASGHPWDISWHLGDGSAWKPFFGPVLPLRELASIQAPPCYTDLEGRFYDELEASAEEAARDALYEARSVVVTQPNNKLSRVLKSMLRELPAQMRAINAAGLASSMAMSDVVAAVAGPSAAEAAREQLQRRLQMVRTLQLSHNDRVSREMRGCLINGHILAVPFSDNYPEAVAQAVINSGVHRTVDPRVKFAMAAYVEQLGSAFVACIWIYVAAIRETS